MMKRVVLAAVAVWFAAPASATTLDVTDAELGVLSEALAAMPYGRVAPLIAKFNSQIREQAKATSPMPQPTEEKKN
jgi:hypothetical protein